MKFTRILPLVLALVGCTQPDKARELLNAQGYSDIQITGYNVWGCSDDDTYHTGFRAKSANGSVIEGTVCAGLFFKGATIRFD
jgi:hypothetical protein